MVTMVAIEHYRQSMLKVEPNGQSSEMAETALTLTLKKYLHNKDRKEMLLENSVNRMVSEGSPRNEQFYT